MSDRGQATEKLNDAIDIAVTLGAAGVYLLTGARGSLTWEQAADRFADLLAPWKEKRETAGCDTDWWRMRRPSMPTSTSPTR